MPRESSLWAWLHDGRPAGCMMQRVENHVCSGTADVIGVWRGGAFVCELKVWPRELEPEQASFLRRWHRAGGSAWVLFQHGDDHRLMRAPDCYLLLAPLSRGRLEQVLAGSFRVERPLDAVVAMSGKIKGDLT